MTRRAPTQAVPPKGKGWSSVPLEGAACFPKITREQESALIARARAGENVRDEIILALQRHVYALAARYAHNRAHIDSHDLVSAANLALLERWETALTKENPFGFLIGVARWTMVNRITGHEDLIKTYSYRESVAVLSLDRPFGEEETTLADLLPVELRLSSPSLPENEDTAYAFLHQAIAGLSEKQRIVIQRHYGLEGYAAEPLNVIERSSAFQSSTRPAQVYYHHRQALARLRDALAPLFQEADKGGAQ